MTLQAIATSFYTKLYTAEQSVSCQSEKWQFPQLDRADKSWLNRGVSDAEVRMAMFQMGEDKAPGPDGFPPGFYQRYWAIVGESVTAFVRHVFFCGTAST